MSTKGSYILNPKKDEGWGGGVVTLTSRVVFSKKGIFYFAEIPQVFQKTWHEDFLY